LIFSTTGASASDVGNRLTYLDEFCDPYYAGLEMPKLTTPQWIGEEGVEAVIVLANDDLRDPEKHEQFMRPILQRLKQIDGRASVSLMANTIPPDHPLYEAWRSEGVSLETHTATHPCPCLQAGDFDKSKATFDNCVDLLTRITGGRAVAFRMPCCDSMNSVSPRFFTEIFGRTTPGGNFVSVDSSIFLLFTPNDPALPRSMVSDDDGQETFRKYVPTDRIMVNLVEDYPYPFVVGRLAWEVPSLMPSDWDAQYLNGKCSPKTVEDLKKAVDAAVIKRGIFSLCYHTHGWISNDQVVEMIDHAQKTHGAKIKFLSFREVLQRLDKNLLGGNSIRAADGQDNGVRLADLNHDGYLDVVVANGQVRQTRVWEPATATWATTDFPVPIVGVDSDGNRRDGGVRFGVLEANGFASILVQNETSAATWHFDGRRWIAESGGLKGLGIDGVVYTSLHGKDRGVRLRDLDGDGICELLVGNPDQNAVFRYQPQTRSWARLAIRLPGKATIVDDQGRDAGLRFVDLDEDGFADLIFSNADGYSAHLFNGIEEGWSREMLAGRRGERAAAEELPMIVRADGTNNGAWFNYRRMWVQNEQTGKAPDLPDHVDSRSFPDDFLAARKVSPGG
jgi:hypothetical protein